jgi:hypothetical protein
MRHSRRLRRYGASTWAMIVPRKRSAEDDEDDGWGVRSADEAPQ